MSKYIKYIFVPKSCICRIQILFSWGTFRQSRNFFFFHFLIIYCIIITIFNDNNNDNSKNNNKNAMRYYWFEQKLFFKLTIVFGWTD